MKLYLGVVPGIFPWLKEPIILRQMLERDVGIVFSYWSFKRKLTEIISKGLHDFFCYEGSIMIDSGAYSAFNSGVNIQLEDYLSFLSEIDLQKNDIIINLDVIGDSNKSMENWHFLTQKIDCNILPVIHMPEKENFYHNEDYIGLGGMVPAFKINQLGSVHDVANWLVSLSLTRSKRFHGFGIGSPFHQIAFEDYLHSVDWIGWRRNSAVCSCYTPEGSVYIHQARKTKKRGKGLTPELFELYSPPFIDSQELLFKKGTEGWVNRALWNVWWFLLAKDHKKQIEVSKYVRSIKKRIKQSKIDHIHKK